MINSILERLLELGFDDYLSYPPEEIREILIQEGFFPDGNTTEEIEEENNTRG